MAPTAPTTSQTRRPSARTLRHQRITGQIHPLLPSKLFRPDAAVSDDFLSSKRDKRLIKHSSFLSRVRSSSDKISKPSSSSSSRRGLKTKQRRPGNKIASLGSLEDALPELEREAEANAGKVKHKSLKSRPGALRRKERVVKGEMQRFGMSMARLAEVTPSPDEQTSTKKGENQIVPDASTDAPSQEEKKPAEGASSSAQTTNRWAALRGYISATMEQNPAFANK